MREARRRVTAALAICLVGLGCAVIVQTVRVDGELGYLLGAILVVAGALRLALLRMA